MITRKQVTTTKVTEVETVICDHCGKDISGNYDVCALCGRQFCPGEPFVKRSKCFDNNAYTLQLKEVRDIIHKYPCQYCMSIFTTFFPDVEKNIRAGQIAYNTAREFEEKWGEASRRVVE